MQLRHGPLIPALARIVQRQPVAQLVILGGIHHLPAADKRVIELRMLLNQPDAENAGPGHSVQMIRC